MKAVDPWFRVHFRNNKTLLVKGRAELERIERRKVPKVIMVEDARSYTCGECGKIEAWLPSWRWYGSWQDLEDGKPVLHFCSDACQEAFSLQHPPKPRPAPPSAREHTRIMAYEPKRGAPNWRKLDDAKKAADSRHFPMPKHKKLKLAKREGQCRWCGERITSKYAWQRSWHTARHGDERDCQHEWLLHTDINVQWWHIVQRDGLGCAIDGKGDGHWTGHLIFEREWEQKGFCTVYWSEKLEVDHIVPLWKVRHLPDDERRAYFGPDNLWLLGTRAHRAKTSIEAAERAEWRNRDD